MNSITAFVLFRIHFISLQIRIATKYMYAPGKAALYRNAICGKVDRTSRHTLSLIYEIATKSALTGGSNLQQSYF
jgi:hypothetical protein